MSAVRGRIIYGVSARTRGEGVSASADVYGQGGSIFRYIVQTVTNFLVMPVARLLYEKVIP